MIAFEALQGVISPLILGLALAAFGHLLHRILAFRLACTLALALAGALWLGRGGWQLLGGLLLMASKQASKRLEHLWEWISLFGPFNDFSKLVMKACKSSILPPLSSPLGSVHAICVNGLCTFIGLKVAEEVAHALKETFELTLLIGGTGTSGSTTKMITQGTKP